MRGTHEISKIYHGTSLVYSATHPDILLDYIANGPDSETTNKAVWFDTGVTISSSFTPRLEVKTESHTNAQSWPIGAVNNTSWNGIALYTPNSSGVASVRYHNRSIAADVTYTLDTPHTIVTYRNSSNYPVLIVDGSTYTGTSTAGATLNEINLYLFTRNNQTGEVSSGSPSGMKIYYVKIWNNDKILIRFYIPVLHWVNNQYVACFYDKVNKNYIYNLGTDTPGYRAKGDYVLDFIANSLTSSNTTGNSYKLNFDTGVTLVTGLNYDTKFYVGGNNSSTGENYIFGTRSSGGNKYALFAPSASSSDLFFTVSKINASTNWSYGVPIKLSTYMNTSNMRCMCVDNSSYTGQQQENSSLDLFNGTYTMYIHGNAGNQRQGNRIYYFCIRNSSEIPLRNYVPVLHNGIPAYYDFNTNTYIYNTGTGTPVYSLI